MVYTWKNGRYVYAARDFADFYKTEIERIRKDIEEEKQNITDISDDSYIGTVLSLAITYAHIGDAARGVAELEALLKVNAKTSEQAKHRREIIEDFRGGDSAKRLREMRYGDPMPLG
jgi:hypothetical protein